MLCETLVRQRYLDSNPFETVKASKYGVFKSDATRSFTQQQWDFLIQHLETYEKNSRYFRLRFMLTLAYETGMRLSEMAAARAGDIQSFPLSGSSEMGYQLHVIGKGNKPRDVALSHNVIQELNTYLAHRGIKSYQDAPPETPLIDVVPGYTLYETRENGEKSTELRSPERTLSSRRIFDIFKAFLWRPRTVWPKNLRKMLDTCTGPVPTGYVTPVVHMRLRMVFLSRLSRINSVMHRSTPRRST
jgi:integrase